MQFFFILLIAIASAVTNFNQSFRNRLTDRNSRIGPQDTDSSQMDAVMSILSEMMIPKKNDKNNNIYEDNNKIYENNYEELLNTLYNDDDDYYILMFDIDDESENNNIYEEKNNIYENNNLENNINIDSINEILSNFNKKNSNNNETERKPVTFSETERKPVTFSETERKPVTFSETERKPVTFNEPEIMRKPVTVSETVREVMKKPSTMSVERNQQISIKQPNDVTGNGITVKNEASEITVQNESDTDASKKPILQLLRDMLASDETVERLGGMFAD
eukprot:GHVL01042970.1.p1 GENE.GHVL01042970.1~~GHVL01042970.1.p1  ORF type:complete len:278 (-),score=118.03 GHVL01042970.1:101-934(-)